MKQLEIDGVQVEIPGICDCGAICTEEDARLEVSGWNKSACPCSFCGELIKVSSITMKHRHNLGPKDWSPVLKHPHLEEDFCWGSSGWARYESNWGWTAHGPWGFADVKAHVGCAKLMMPFGNFELTDYNRPEGVPEGYALPVAELKACATCGELPTALDLARVTGRIYSFAGPCVYCGGPIKVESIDLFHGTWSGKHTGNWHFSKYKREEMLTWWGQMEGILGYTQLEFTGHLRCATRAMPHLKIQS